MEKNLIFEIGVEEIPHGILTFTTAEFFRIAKEKLDEYGFVYKDVRVFSTPRRLALFITNLSEKTKEKIIEKKGPSVKAGFDENGNPTKALIGFLTACRAKIEEVKIQNNYTYLYLKEGGKPVKEIFPSFARDVIFSISFPKSMRWGNYSTSFVRPIRWVTVLYDGEEILFSLDGLPTRNITYGHRFLSTSVISLKDATEYEKALKENYVIPDPEERKKIIKDEVDKKARNLNARPIMGDKLLDELVNLVEFPVIAVGTFEKEFLTLPKEVLISEMVDHQKFVPLEKEDGTLLNKFLIVLNTFENPDIVRGNERVIRARFSDGRFFYDEDRKVKLEEYVPKLEGVMFARGLGTMKEKVERIIRLTEKLAKILKMEKFLENAKRVALLCKADLVTNMVYEFPELQGIIGYYYALESKENERVAKSIKEHYQPRFSGDDLPAFEEGILVSLADKFDNLFALYSVGNFVSGSKDPFALRRQTLGIIRILIEKKLNLDIYGFLNEVFEEYKNYLSVKKEEFEEKVKSFITTRTKTVLKEYCFEYDEIEAGITTEVSNIYDAYLRIEAIHSIRQTEDFKNLAIAFKRVKNIIKNEKKVEFNESLLIENAEKELYNLYKQNREKFLACVKSQNYQQAAKILAGFRPVVDRFFDEVLVMEKDEKIKNNRVALLYVIDELFLNLIDFEKIVVE